MSAPEKYTPLSERLQQDVWHDNFVPKYSAIASARPSRLVLAGVWLIFLPMALWSLLYGLVAFSNPPDIVSAVMLFIAALLGFTLAVSILFTQTRRFQRARSGSETEQDHDDD
jgi:predicted permease